MLIAILTLKFKAIQYFLLSSIQSKLEFSAAAIFEAFGFVFFPVAVYILVYQKAVFACDGLAAFALDGVESNAIADHTGELLNGWERPRVHVFG